MTEQLKNDSFGWNESADEAFCHLTEAISTIPLLALLDFTQPFTIETDASNHGLGVVLMQYQRWVAYFNHVLSPQAQLKSIYECELIAIVLAI